ncbi:MAG: hypothetical protein KDC82_03765 [Bacteroidetes bacterium]|nr:hypothetical protein [Bacteroidota bacterium]
MKNIAYILLASFGILLASCTPEIQYTDLSEFKMEEELVENLSEVELLYSSATPDGEEDLSYLIQLIAINKSTLDTVNILTTFNRGGGNGDAKNLFKFYSLDSEEAQAYFDELYNKNSETVRTLEEIKAIQRVSFDPRFAYLSKNNYATCYGFIDK